MYCEKVNKNTVLLVDACFVLAGLAQIAPN